MFLLTVQIEWLSIKLEKQNKMWNLIEQNNLFSVEQIYFSIFGDSFQTQRRRHSRNQGLPSYLRLLMLDKITLKSDESTVRRWWAEECAILLVRVRNMLSTGDLPFHPIWSDCQPRSKREGTAWLPSRLCWRDTALWCCLRTSKSEFGMTSIRYNHLSGM